MTNTALRAGAQSADNTHLVFANEEHEKFYFKMVDYLKKAFIYGHTSRISS